MSDDCTLWVGGLANEVTEDHLYELFLQAGPLEKVMRVKDKDGTLRSFAFVEFCHAESVPYAIQVMDGTKLYNRHMRLKGRSGSHHDNSHSDSSSSHSQSNISDSRSHRGSSDFSRSRSYQGAHGHHMKHGMESLTQPGFNSYASYNASNMQPQSFEDRRNRVLHKQSMSRGAHVRNHGGHNYSQSFSGYGQQQQWYLDNY